MYDSHIQSLQSLQLINCNWSLKLKGNFWCNKCKGTKQTNQIWIKQMNPKLFVTSTLRPYLFSDEDIVVSFSSVCIHTTSKQTEIKRKVNDTIWWCKHIIEECICSWIEATRRTKWSCHYRCVTIKSSYREHWMLCVAKIKSTMTSFNSLYLHYIRMRSFSSSFVSFFDHTILRKMSYI